MIVLNITTYEPTITKKEGRIHDRSGGVYLNVLMCDAPDKAVLITSSFFDVSNVQHVFTAAFILPHSSLYGRMSRPNLIQFR